MADGLDGHLLLDIFQVIVGSGDRRHAGAGEADLGGGAELVHQIRISGLLAFMQDLQNGILVVVIQMMHIIGIVPVDTEILSGGLQSGKPAHRLVRIGDSLRVGILGHAPDALDRRVRADQLFHHVHIRSFRRHGNVDHLDPEILRDREMPVITGNRAEEFHNRELAPGGASAHAVGHGTGYRIVHHIQAGIAVNDDLVGGNLDQVGQKLLRLLDAVDHAVVSAVDPLSALQIGGAVQHIHHSHGNVKLLRGRLSSGHIQLQAHILKLLVLRLQFILQSFQLFSASVFVRLHLFLHAGALPAPLMPACVLHKKEADYAISPFPRTNKLEKGLEPSTY